MILVPALLGFILAIFGIYGFWEMWGSGAAQYNLDIALKITGSGTALVAGTSIAIACFYLWAEKQTLLALRKKYPTQPGRWRFDWLNGFSRQNMASLYTGSIFALSWAILTVPVIFAKVDELPPVFFWVFAVGFPIISAMLLLQQLFKWVQYLIYGRTKLIFNSLTFKQGKSGSVVLTGKSVALFHSATARIKVIFKYVSKTVDSDGTNYSNEEVELAGNDWSVSDIVTATGKSINLSGSIPNGHPDFGTEIILPQYREKAGTISYKLFIHSKVKGNKMDMVYDVPVFSSIPQYPPSRSFGRVIDGFRFASTVGSILFLVLVLALFDAHKLRHTQDPSASFVSNLIGFIDNKVTQITPAFVKNKVRKNTSTLSERRYRSNQWLFSASQLNAVDGMNGATEFMLIARYRDLERTKRAYKAGGDLYVVDDFGRIAIHHAVSCHPNQKKGRTDLVLTYLLSLDSQMLSAKDSDGRTPLYCAINSACLEGVNALLAHGAVITPELIEVAKRERTRLHSRDNFVKEAVLNSEHIVEILQSHHQVDSQAGHD